jgi:UDP-N-acetylglucosamine 1-carboxyvinyltransferase
MVAKIEQEDNYVIVKESKLQGAEVTATDLRAGAALILAGLAAEGETRINEIYHVKRGYENFVEKLSQVGVDLKIK